MARAARSARTSDVPRVAERNSASASAWGHRVGQEQRARQGERHLEQTLAHLPNWKTTSLLRTMPSSPRAMRSTAAGSSRSSRTSTRRRSTSR